mmetsp:Transcript_7094/g.17632  ORF Transcript_7094/g.17632 Transcript_7094/m.17632 type:complete len:208 (-) Transcript_7094:98-721(-)
MMSKAFCTAESSSLSTTRIMRPPSHDGCTDILLEIWPLLSSRCSPMSNLRFRMNFSRDPTRNFSTATYMRASLKRMNRFSRGSFRTRSRVRLPSLSRILLGLAISMPLRACCILRSASVFSCPRVASLHCTARAATSPRAVLRSWKSGLLMSVCLWISSSSILYRRMRCTGMIKYDSSDIPSMPWLFSRKAVSSARVRPFSRHSAKR